MTNTRTLKVFEAFSGIGSQRMALRNKGIDHEVVAISEIDQDAIKSYMAIHGETNNVGDISQLTLDQIPYHDLFTYSFPCQDLSLAGKKQGMEEGSGTRSSLLWECKRVIEGKRPKYLLLENVTNLVGKKNKPLFDTWLAWLESQGYTNYWSKENALDYNVAQNRDRVFVVSILGEHTPFQFPIKQHLTKSIQDYLEKDVDQKYYKSFEALKKLEAWKSFQLPLTRIIGMESHSPTLTARGAGLNHSGQILICNNATNMNLQGNLDFFHDISVLGIRNITPRESWKLMGFTDSDYDKARAVGMTDAQLYKQAGNSIVVPVLEGIFGNLFN
jgi:DNA (cytosine-5)-methyltransferase 1